MLARDVTLHVWHVCKVIDDFMPVRLDTYHKRKQAQVEALEGTVNILENKARFVDSIATGSIDLSWPVTQLEDHLRNEGYFGKQTAAEAAASVDDEDVSGTNFKYLLDMPLSSLSADRVVSLKKQEADTSNSLEHLKNQTVRAMHHTALAELPSFL